MAHGGEVVLPRWHDVRALAEERSLLGASRSRSRFLQRMGSFCETVGRSHFGKRDEIAGAWITSGFAIRTRIDSVVRASRVIGEELVTDSTASYAE